MKKFLCVIVTIMALALTGCNNVSGISTTPAPTRPVATTPVQTTPAPTTPPTTPAPTEPTTAEPVDELWLLETTFEIAERDGGIYLLRGEKIYTLNQYSSKVPGKDYLPMQIGGSLRDLKFRDTGRTIGGGIPLCGYNVPIPVISEEDKIIVFSDNFYDLKLATANLMGYSFYMFKRTEGSKTYWGYDADGNIVKFDNKIEFTVTDSKENVVTDFSSLNKDEICTLSYYEGTRYTEIKLKADCLLFDYDIINLSGYTVSGNLTKNGYAEYYVSNIPVGLYVIGLADGGVLDGLLIEVTEK